MCSSCRGKFRRQRLHELGEAGITLGPNGIPCVDSVSSSALSEGISHGDDECVGDDSNDEIMEKAAAEDTSDECLSYTERCEDDIRYFAENSYTSNLPETQSATDNSKVWTTVSCGAGNDLAATCNFRVLDILPCYQAGEIAGMGSSSSEGLLDASSSDQQSQPPAASLDTPDILHGDSTLSGLHQGEQRASPNIDTNIPTFHRIESYDELRQSLLSYKLIANTIPDKIDKCSVVSLTDCDDSSSHSSNIDDDNLSRSSGCPDVHSSNAMCNGRALQYETKSALREFSSPPLSPCVDPL